MPDPLPLELTLPPLLMPAQTAHLIGIGARTLWRRSRDGTIPAPLKIGGSVRYRRDEILAWIAVGCPAAEMEAT